MLNDTDVSHDECADNDQFARDSDEEEVLVYEEDEITGKK